MRWPHNTRARCPRAPDVPRGHRSLHSTGPPWPRGREARPARGGGDRTGVLPAAPARPQRRTRRVDPDPRGGPESGPPSPRGALLRLHGRTHPRGWAPHRAARRLHGGPARGGGRRRLAGRPGGEPRLESQGPLVLRAPWSLPVVLGRDVLYGDPL